MSTQGQQQQNGRGQQGRAMVRSGDDRLANLQGLFAKAQGKIKSVLPRHLTPEKLMRLVLSAASRTPKLLECSPNSILLASLQSAALGLEPNTPLGHAYLVPHWNGTTRQMEAQFIPGYRGLVTLAVQSGEIKTVVARAVYEGDSFEVELGLDERLVHRPLLTDEKRPLVAVYSIASFANGAKTFDFMSKAQVDGIRARSKSKDNGPWVTDYDEMAKKSVIRRHSKLMPMSVDKAQGYIRALDAQERAETGDGPDFSDILGDLGEPLALEGEEAPAQLPQSRTTALEDKLGAAPKSDPAAAKPKADEPPMGALLDDAPMPSAKPMREPGSDG